MENLTDSKHGETPSNDDKLIKRMEKITKLLYSNIRELGYDQKLHEANTQIADIRERLNYILHKTQSAADNTLCAIDNIKPIQSNLSSKAIILSQEWQELIRLENSSYTNKNLENFRHLFLNTLSYLDDIPKQADVTNNYLQTVTMAQDFQDLTGQVINKIFQLLQLIESELIQVLLDNSGSSKSALIKNKSITSALLNGPTINPQSNSDTLSNQKDVDSFLASLGN